MEILLKIQPLIAMTFQVKSTVLLNGEIFLLPLPAPNTAEIPPHILWNSQQQLLEFSCLLTVCSQDDVLPAQGVGGKLVSNNPGANQASLFPHAMVSSQSHFFLFSYLFFIDLQEH